MPPTAFLAGWSNPDRFSFWLAIALAVLAIGLRRSRRAPLLIGAAVVAVVAAVAAFSPQFDLVGWHGFMRGSTIFRLVDGAGLPPEDPLFAGGTLRYPWAQDWLLATLARATSLSPHLLDIGLELVLFAGFLAAGAWLAALVTEDREVIALAVLFTAFGVSAFHGGFVQDAVGRAFPWLSLETRAVPLDKFASITAMPPGYLAMLVAAAAGVAMVCRPVSTRTMALVIALCTLVAALMHPLSWAGVLVFEGVVAMALVLRARDADLSRLGWLGAAVMLPSLAALPYLNSIGVSESSDGWSGLTSPASLLTIKAWDLCLFVAPLLLLAYVCRNRLLQLLEDGNRALALLVAAMAAMAAAYLAIRFPGRNEYKFLLFLAPCAAVPFALCVRELLDRHLALGFLVIVLTLLPGARALGYRPWFLVTDPCRADGPSLRSLHPELDDLYQWIANETPRDAVFIAADLRVPPLGRRPLYIPVQTPWIGRDGWGLGREQLLQWHVRRPDTVMWQRQHLATLMLDANFEDESAASVIAAIESDIGGRPLFVHERIPRLAALLERTPGFRLAFRNAFGSVYAVSQPPPEAAQEVRR